MEAPTHKAWGAAYRLITSAINPNGVPEMAQALPHIEVS